MTKITLLSVVVASLLLVGCNDDKSIKTAVTPIKTETAVETSKKVDAVKTEVALKTATTTASADAGKGQKIYSKKLKSACGINGAEFAKKHTQDEWKVIGVAGLKDETAKICPDAKIDKIKDKYFKDLYDFVEKFASDSGNVPSC